MHRDRGVAQHRLGPRGGDGYPFACLFALGVHHRIFEVIEVPVGVLGQDLGERRRVERRAVVPRPFERALGLDLHDLEIRDRGLKLGVPVDEPLVLVNEPLAIELDEHLGDRARQALVEREALAAPVAGGAEALELGHDRAAQFRLPRPDPLDERLASHGAAVRLLPLHELALDHHLRGDAGVIDARLPQHVAAVHAPIAAENILKRVVERMAHMQVAGDVRRRNDDAERLRLRPVGPAGPEGARFLPKRGGAAFRRGEVKGFVHHGILVCDAVGDAPEIRQRPSERSEMATDAAGASATGVINASSRSKSTRRGERTAYFRPRAIRSISARTSRSTMAGRLSSSHCLEHRPQHVAHHAVGKLGAADVETGRQGPERQRHRLVRLRQTATVSALRWAASSAGAGDSASTACGRRQTTVGAFASGRWGSLGGVAARRGRSVFGIDDLRRRLGSCRLGAASLRGVVGDDVADRGENLLHRRLVGPLRAVNRLELAIAGIRIDCAHADRLAPIQGALSLCTNREAGFRQRWIDRRVGRPIQCTIGARSRHRQAAQAKRPYCPLGVLSPIHLFFT